MPISGILARDSEVKTLNPAIPNNMKHLFSPGRAFASLRVVVAGACVLTAAALAFVATANNNSSGPISKSPVIQPTAHDSLNAASEISDKDGSAVDPTAAAAEDYANRAYPGPAEIDLGALINAQAGLQQFLQHATPTPVPTVAPSPTDTPSPTATPTATPKGGKKGGKGGKGGKKGKGTPTPAPTPATVIIDHPSPPEPPPLPFWQQVTGNTATDPNVLTFTGSTQNVSGRVTGLALDTHNGCTAGFCRVWVAAAGGGIWRTTNALATFPTWTYVSGDLGGFFTNAIGAITFFDDGTTNGVLYVGTGEPNASADSESGLGIFRSTDGGNTWAFLPAQIGPITTTSPAGGGTFSPNGTYTGDAFLGRSISGIAVDPTNSNILYVSSARGVRGVNSTDNGATSNPTTPRPPFGLFKSTDGGLHFSFIWDGSNTCPGSCLGGDLSASIRGVTEVKIDASNHNIVYASAFPGQNGTSGGVYRSTNGGTNWTQIKTALNANDNVDRCAFDITPFAGDTRMYVGCGNDGTNTAQVYRSNTAQTGTNASFTNLTALEVVPSTAGYCTSQCWYDNVIYTPPGFPDIVYVAGSFDYNTFGHGSDGRGVVYATDAGASGDLWSDATWDAQNNGTPAGSCCQPNAIAPNGIHPDQHALLTVPGNPFLFFEGSDGGIVRSDGTLTNISSQCLSRTYPPGTGTLLQCELLTGLPPCLTPCGVPTTIFTSINSGLNTLQLQSISVASDNVLHFQFGTQDNGTYNAFAFAPQFFQEIYGDGGQSGFNIANSAIRFNTFTANQHDANFQNGNPLKWVVIGAPILNGEGFGGSFYPAIIADPTVAGTILAAGPFHVWRTTDNGGSQAFLETNCPEFTTNSNQPGCGDFVTLGGAAFTNDQGCLDCSFWGGRSGGQINVISRVSSNSSTAWFGTSAGRLFISENVNAAAGSVVFNRIDAGGANGDPGRVVNGIAVDPFNPRHAFVAYGGYNFNTPSQKGHVFSVTWGGAGAATFTDISGNIWDIPMTDAAYDPVTGDVYVSSDFVVFRLAASFNPAQQWFVAGLNMPMVEITKLTILPNQRVLYAATHGLGAWALFLP
jgi:hypothetical protein